MNLRLLDWCIITVFFIFVTLAATYARRYTRSVADFLSASRCAGRYLLTVSGEMASLGAISIIANFQMFYQAGFAVSWWQSMALPVGIFIALTGWVIYRFRQTRVLTMAEFMERRYSRKFRVFVGIIMFVSGILNFGIFPGVGAQFFIHFCGFGEAFSVGGISLSTYPLVMAVLLVVSLYFTYMGGQIAVTITDFIQGIFCSLVFVIISLFVLVKVGWTNIEEVLTSPENVHMIHPFQGDNIPDFNVWYFMMGLVLAFYGTRAWQGAQGYNTSALTPHEAKMGGIIGALKGLGGQAMSLLIPIGVYTVLHHSNFTAFASGSNTVLNAIPDEQVRNQMIIPVVMSQLLPVGLLGCFAAVFLAAFIGNHDTYLHSWGSIFIQDVVMPFRKKPFTEKQHMRLLRLSIFGVALFIFIFSLVWRQKEAILLWFQITGAIYLGGAGAVILGGLYWKKGTTAAAYSATITGSTLAVAGIVIQQIYSDFFLNGMEISFLVAAISCLVYMVVSLLAPAKDFELDKLLHRGPYTIPEDTVVGSSGSRGIWSKLGLTKEFSTGDKVIFFSVLGFTFFWFSLFIIGTIYHFIFGIPMAWWMVYWRYYVLLSIILGMGLTIWVSIGGFIDVSKMLKRLRTVHRDEHDDGWVQEDPKKETSKSRH